MSKGAWGFFFSKEFESFDLRQKRLVQIGRFWEYVVGPGARRDIKIFDV